MKNPALLMLTDAFDDVISQFPRGKVFTAHAFLRALSHQNQVAYIEALHAMRDAKDPHGNPSPFQALHAKLSRSLKKRADLVRHVRDVTSENIFGGHTECAEYERV